MLDCFYALRLWQSPSPSLEKSGILYESWIWACIITFNNYMLFNHISLPVLVHQPKGSKPNYTMICLEMICYLQALSLSLSPFFLIHRKCKWALLAAITSNSGSYSAVAVIESLKRSTVCGPALRQVWDSSFSIIFQFAPLNHWMVTIMGL